MSPSPSPKIERNLIAALREWATALWRFIILALVAVVAWQGKNMANDFISANSAVVAAQTAVAEAKVEAAAAKAAAIEAARKADDSLAAESRILAAIKEMQVDQGVTNSSLTGLTQHVMDLEHQVDRIEKKQDLIPPN